MLFCIFFLISVSWAAGYCELKSSCCLTTCFSVCLILFALRGCRWLKFEEDVEDGGERWSKPYVATLSLHSLFELRSCILNGIVMLDMRANSLEEIAGLLTIHFSMENKTKTRRSVKLTDCLLSSIQTWFSTNTRRQSRSERRCVGKSAMLFSNSTTTKTRRNWPIASPSSAPSQTSERSSPSHTLWIRTVRSSSARHTWPAGGSLWRRTKRNMLSLGAQSNMCLLCHRNRELLFLKFLRMWSKETIFACTVTTVRVGTRYRFTGCKSRNQTQTHTDYCNLITINESEVPLECS